MNEQLLSTKEAAHILRVAAGTLVVWRCRKRYGLRYVRLGSRIFYKPSDLDDFILRRTNTGAPELAAEPQKRTRRAKVTT